MKEKWKSSIKIYQKVDIILQDMTSSRSFIQDFEEDQLMIGPPVQNGIERLLEKGAKYTILLYGEERVYTLETEIVHRTQDDLPMYTLRVNRCLGELQRRQHVRAIVNLHVHYVAMLNDVKEIEKQMVHSESLDLFKLQDCDIFDGWILNLSASGVCLSIEEKIDAGQSVLLRFELEDHTLTLIGDICYRELRMQSGKTGYTYGISFSGLKPSFEDRIIRYVFAKIRQNRQYDL